MSKLQYFKTPVQEVNHGLCDKAGIRLLIKREDLNHPAISGNKWWKLKYNLGEARRTGQSKILTFGGAYSNHIFATAAAGKELHLKTIGIIRGEKPDQLNPTLSFAEDCGMELHFISREDYRKKTDQLFIETLTKKFGDFYLIPEGGTNVLAVKGCEEFVNSQLSDIAFDHLFLPVGTGGTIAGMICGFKGEKEIKGICVLKNGDFLREEIRALIFEHAGKNYGKWDLLTSYHHGGYAKTTSALTEFILEMQEGFHLPLDPVYTGKVMWAVMREVERGAFHRGSTILVLHTGGLKGKNFISA